MKDNIQFFIIVFGQFVLLVGLIWKISQWTKAVNLAVASFYLHVKEDQEAFRAMTSKLSKLVIEVTRIKDRMNGDRRRGQSSEDHELIEE